ncbi:S-formylglutathione hydrolase [Photobacterium phosphoreum]|uniref:S-formylglutathione hydrolase n=1 Tax=Photobacterium phosphoreum TaxID=659 RepID=A0AAW4ZSL9_PHOPO|nr:S-formylglutathione hydrolase [Photobacterium phosphoreum]MCD9464821.1 S-formylglutathione hydrolase [Photobacterium phosphoreum]MCD9470708.1 S-formylglutathione hydrolase [Photobacterium phosphoreum]MCD9473170.1 S-formylglutathione hydrolase [Photobacterium phosphoreum]MCD9492154.1 S-formylglutathione hydrolase [Photobacterium phosphoreum]MCD9503545.1 S-formylglutathione hydrolase [Photobacterium phosphoreum]
MPLENISCNKSAGGWHKQYTHRSEALNCDMRFAIYLPPQCAAGKKVPVIYWLSGLTCTDENFMQKAGAQRMAAELGVAIVAPDTSPRGEGVADDPQGAYDFGLGAGFYVNATEAPWNRHYHMYDYIVNELPTLIEAHFPVTNQRAITGHSMGGHGALMIALRNPERYSSASAFSPIANPINSAWGQKALTGYLGSNTKNWKQYDSSELMRIADVKLPMLVDQGTHDNFYNDGQLRTETLVAAAEANSYPLEVRMQDGYDHSYYFMASFIDDHLRFHVENFNK